MFFKFRLSTNLIQTDIHDVLSRAIGTAISSKIEEATRGATNEESLSKWIRDPQIIIILMWLKSTLLDELFSNYTLKFEKPFDTLHGKFFFLVIFLKFYVVICGWKLISTSLVFIILLPFFQIFWISIRVVDFEIFCWVLFLVNVFTFETFLAVKIGSHNFLQIVWFHSLNFLSTFVIIYLGQMSQFYLVVRKYERE